MALDLFQSTLPAWGETASARRASTVRTEFQSTLPAWGETRHAVGQKQHGDISIHSPRMGRDGSAGDHHPPGHDFNPLSPHGERHTWAALRLNYSDFNPLSPHGERPDLDKVPRLEQVISIHSPRMGRDSGRHPRYHGGTYFNPLSPHGERPD